ncbi:MAG: DUF4136 domain-containing protein [Sulfurovum sp.]|nr:DUF4136 domain-containing protein [Sulfurovum sp.]
MKKWLAVLLMASAVIGMNCCVPTSDIEVESVTNEKANLNAYKTYQFLEDSGIVEDDGKGKLKESNKKVAAMIEEIINTELQKAGKKPAADNPDFFVAYVGGSNLDAVKMKLDEKGKQIVKKQPQAALLIMLVDADTGTILRIATADGEVKGLPQDQTRKRIEYAVKKMLKGI